jgi:MtN3 and saliva related transmembrane protein
MQWIGYGGLVALVLSWIPQSLETIRNGKCSINLSFLVLVLIGNICLAVYAWSIDDTVFSLLNSVSSVGVLLNLYYKLLPRKTE